MKGRDADLTERIEGWPRAAIRLVETADGFVHVHLFVTGTGMVDQFAKDGQWVASESVRWLAAKRRTLGEPEPELGDALTAFGVPKAEAVAIAAEMRASAEPLAGTDDPWWRELSAAVAFFGIFLAGWALAIVLAIVVLVLVLT